MTKRLGTFILLTAVLTTILTIRYYRNELAAPWGYVNAGAVNPYYGVMRPLGYRLLMPVLLNFCHIIPTPGDPRVPLPFAIGLCLVFFGFLRAMQFSVRLSIFGTILLACCGGMIDLLKDFGINNTDTSSHILVLLSFWAMFKKQDAWFSTATLLGVFNREWALVLLPCWYLYNYGFSITKSSLLRFGRVCIPSILVYGFVRYAYFPNTALGVMSDELGNLLPASETTTFNFYWNAILHIQWQAIYERVFSMQFFTYGMIGLLPYTIMGYRHAPQPWQRLCIFYSSLCVLQLLITTDVWRLVFYLFPMMIPMLLYWLQSIENHIPENVFYAILIAIGLGYLILESYLIAFPFSLLCLFIITRMKYQTT